MTRLITFKSIGVAAEIWDLDSFTDLKTNAKVPLKKYPNNGPVPPSVG